MTEEIFIGMENCMSSKKSPQQAILQPIVKPCPLYERNCLLQCALAKSRFHTLSLRRATR